MDRESTVREWLEDPRGRDVFEPVFKQMQENAATVFGGGESGGAVIGMDMMGFMLEMPLLGILHFQESLLPMPADDLVDAMLDQVYGVKA